MTNYGSGATADQATAKPEASFKKTDKPRSGLPEAGFSDMKLTSAPAFSTAGAEI